MCNIVCVYLTGINMFFNFVVEFDFDVSELAKNSGNPITKIMVIRKNRFYFGQSSGIHFINEYSD